MTKRQKAAILLKNIARFGTRKRDFGLSQSAALTDWSQQPQLMSIRQAADALKVHPNTLRLWDQQGTLRAVRIGSRRDRRYPKERIQALTSSRRPPQDSGPIQKRTADVSRWVWPAATAAVMVIGVWSSAAYVQAQEGESTQMLLRPESCSGWTSQANAVDVDLLSGAPAASFTRENSAAYRSETGFIQADSDQSGVVSGDLSTVSPDIVCRKFEARELRNDDVLTTVQAQLSYTSSAALDSADSLVLELSLQGGPWQVLDLRAAGDVPTAYWNVDLPMLSKFERLLQTRLRLRVESEPGLEPTVVYLDGMQLEATVSRVAPVSERTLERKTDELDRLTSFSQTTYQAAEQPVLTIPQKKTKKFLFFKTGEATWKLRDLILTDASGTEISAEPRLNNIQVGDDINTEISLDPSSLHPGKYTVEVTMVTDDGNLVTIKDEFLWGVVTMNVSRSVATVGQEQVVTMGVLDDSGRTICDSDMTLVVTDPKGKRQEFSTAAKTIAENPDCVDKGVTTIPDYQVAFHVEYEGVYQMHLEADTTVGKRVLDDNFESKKLVQFDVERVQYPSRIYPLAPYPVRIATTPVQDYFGTVRERVPANFVLTEVFPGATIYPDPDRPDVNIVEWIVDWKKDETNFVGYTFDAPDISPAIFRIGPLEVGGSFIEVPLFKEPRQWQIASDAVTATKYAGTATDADNGQNCVSWLNTSNATGNTTSTSATCSIGGNNNLTNDLILTNFGFTGSDIPSGSTIDGVTVQVEWQGGATNVVDSLVQLTKNGSTGVGDDKGTDSSRTAKSLQTYGGASDGWNASLTQADVVSSNFGVILNYLKNSGGPSQLVDVYRINVTINYTAPAAEITVSGVVRQTDESSAYDCSLNNLTIHVSVNGAANQTATCTASGGTFSVTTAPEPSAVDDPVVVFIDSAESVKGTTATLAASTTADITNLDIMIDRVVVTHESGTAMSNSKMGTGDNADAGIRYSVSGGALTVESGMELHVKTGKTFTPGGTVTTNATGGDFHVDDSATATLASATNSIGRDILVDTGATLNINANTTVSGGDVTTAGTATVTTTAGTPAVTVSGTGTIGGGSNQITFYALTINGSGDTVTVASNVAVNNTLTIGAAADGNNDTLSINSGIEVTSGTSGTVTLVGSGIDTITGAGRLVVKNNNLGTSGTISCELKFNGANLTIPARTYSGDLVLNSTGATRTFTLAAGTYTVSGNMHLDAGSTGNVVVTGATNNPTVNVAGDLDFVGAGAGSEQITTGTGTWTVSGNVDLTGGTATFTSTNTFQMNGSSKTLTSAGQAFQNFSVTGGSVTVQDNTTFTETFTLSNGTFAHGANNDLLFLGNVALANGTTFTKASGSGLFILDGDNDNETFTDNTSPLQNLGHVHIGQSPGTTLLSSDFSATSLTINTGDSFYTDGYEVTLTDFLTLNGTGLLDLFDGGEGDGTIITLGGNWTMSSSGTFNASTDSLVHFSSTSGSNANRTVSTGGKTFNDVQFQNAGTTNDDYAISGNLDINGNLTHSDGELVLNSGSPNVNVAGSVSIAAGATVTKGVGTWTFDGTTAETYTDSNGTTQNIGAVSFNKTDSVAPSTNNKVTLASSMTADTVTIDGTSGSEDTLDLGNSGYTLTVANAGATATVLTITGTLTVNTSSTVKFTATNSGGNINIPTNSYASLSCAPGAAEIYDVAGSFTVASLLTIDTNCTYTIASSQTTTLSANTGTSLTLNGTLAGTGRLTYQNSATTFPTGGTISAGILRFDHVNGNMSMPARTDYQAVEAFNGTGTARTLTLGTAGSQTLTTASHFSPYAESTANMSIAGNTHNPTINIGGNLDFLGVGAGTEVVTTGTGIWTVSGNVDFTGGTFTATSGNTFRMNGTAGNTLVSANNFYNLEIIPASATITMNTSNFSVTNNVVIGTNSTFSLSSGRTVDHNSSSGTLTMNSGSVLTGSGTYAYRSTAAFPTGGTISLFTLQFTASYGDQSLPGRTIAATRLQFVNFDNTFARTVTIGSAGGQTLTQSGSCRSLAQGNANLTIDAATWDPDVNCGDLETPGTGSGTDIINAGTGTWTATGNVTFNNGQYNYEAGNTLVMSGTSKTLTTAGNALYHFQVTAGSVTASGATTVTGDITLSSGSFTGPAAAFTIGGNWTNSGGTYVEGTGTVTFNGTSSVNLDSGCVDTDACTNENFYDLEINKTSGTDSADNVTLVTSGLRVTNKITITDGELVQGALNVRSEGTAAVSIAAAGKWNNISTGDLKLGGTFVNAGTATFNSNNGSQCADGADSIVITSTVGSTQRAWSGAGTFTIYNVDVTDMTDSSITAYTSTLTNTTWTVGACSITVSGTVYTSANEGTAYDCTSGTGAQLDLVVAVNGDATPDTGTCTSAVGTFSFTATDPGAADLPVAVYVANTETEKATTVTLSAAAATNITGLSIFLDRVAVTQESATAITNSHLSTADNADAGIRYSVSAGALTVESDMELHIVTGKTFTPGGTVTTSATGGNFHVDDGATATIDTATSDIGLDFLVDAGATLNLNANTIVRGGDITTTTTGVVASSAGTVTMRGTGNIGGGSGSIAFTNLTIGDATAATTTAASDLTIATTLDIDASDTFNINSAKTVTLSANTGTSLVFDGTLGGAGTLTYQNTATTFPTTGTISAGILRFDTVNGNLTMPARTDYAQVEAYNGTGTARVVTAGTAISQTLTLSSHLHLLAASTAGITLEVDTWDPTINVGGDLDFTGGGAGTETLSFGGGTWTVSGNFSSDDGSITNTSGSTLVMNGAGTNLDTNSEVMRNVTIDPSPNGQVTLTSDLRAYNTVTIADNDTLYINTGVVLRLSNNASALLAMSANSVLTSPNWGGHMYYSGATFPAVGTISVYHIQFLAAFQDMTIPGRSFTNDTTAIYFINNSAVDRTITIGSAGGQTVSMPGTTSVLARFYTSAGANATFDFELNDPDVTINGDVLSDFGDAATTKSFNMGQGTTWDVAGDFDATRLTVDAGTSLLKMDGSSKALTSSGNSFYDYEVFGGTVSFADAADIDNNLTISAGTLTPAASGTVKVGNNFSNSSTFTHNSSTVTMDGTAGGINGSSATTFNNLTIDPTTAGTTIVSTSDPTVIATLNVAAGDTLSISSGRTVTHTGATLTWGDGTSTISGAGTLRFTDVSGGPATGGVLSSITRFDGTTANIASTTFDARTYGGKVELYSNSGTAKTVSCADASTYTISGTTSHLHLIAAGAGNLSLLCDTVTDPTITIGGDLDFTGGGAGSEAITSGAGTWSVGGNIDFTAGTYTATSGNVLVLNGSAQQTLTTAGNSLDSLTITNNSGTDPQTDPSVIFADSWTVNDTFTATTANTKLRFLAAGTYAPSAINLNGQATGTRVTLRSSSAGTATTFNAGAGSRTVSNLDVKDSNACGSTGGQIDASDGTNLDSGNANCWFINSMTVTLSINAINLGTLDTSNVNQGGVVSTVTSNASTGYISLVKYDATLTSGSDTIPNASGGTIVAGTSEYGASSSDAGNDIGIWSPTACATTATTSNATALSTTFQSFASNTVAVTSEATTLCLLGSRSGTIAPGSYSSSLTIVTTAKF